MKITIIVCLLSLSVYSQSNIDKLIKGGEILVTGLTILKDKSKPRENGLVKICVKNKRFEKITVAIAGKDSLGAALNKSLVIPKDGKECFLELPGGIYTYEIVLPNNEIYKRGEYDFDENMTITVKQ